MKNRLRKITTAILCSTMLLGAIAVTPVTAEAAEEKTLVAGATTGFFGAESLDPAYNWDGWIMSIYGISENLFRLDTNFEPQPWIAESYKNVDDLTWEFTIRDDVSFSNGTKVTADAVKKCFERTYGMNERAEGTLAIDSMTADGQILTIKTKEANPTVLNDLCDPLMAIYDSEGTIDEILGASCTGPFIATSFEPMKEVEMEKNANYWGGEPKLDQVELKIIDDNDALNMALQNGEIDMIAQLPAAGASLFEDTEKYTIDSMTSTRANFLMYNLESENLKDVNVRNAISMCIDRQSYADVVFSGYAEPSFGIYPDMLPYGGTDGFELAVDKYDPEGARTLLEEAGYNASNPLTLKLLTYSYNSQLLQLGDLLQAQLADLGVNLEIETYDVLDEPLAKGDFDIAALNYAMAPTGNAQYFVNMLFTSDAGNNYGHYKNEQVDSLAKTLETTFEEEKRNEITKEIEQEVLNDGAFTFFADQQFICVYSNQVTGFEINPTEYYFVTNEMDITE